MTEERPSVLERLAAISSTSLADAGGGLRVLSPELRPMRPGLTLVGRAVTVDARGDLMGVIEGLRRSGPGDVLVIAAGSNEHAVAGELFATEAVRRGVAGLVIDGRCRDRATLATLDLPVHARGTAPTAFPARAVPVVGVPVRIGSVEVASGDLVLGDDDGIVVATEAEAAAVLEAAEEIERRENALRVAIADGTSLFDHLDYDRHLGELRAGRASRLSFF